MSDVKRLNFTVSQFESVEPYASEHGQYIRYADYAKLEAEAQALREEVAALRARVVVVPDELDGQECHSEWDAGRVRGWSDCLDAVERLNGKAVSEGLLRQLYHGLDEFWMENIGRQATEELLALLDDGKEAGDA